MGMKPEYCGTRNHIELWNNRVLPERPVRIGIILILRGSLLPIALWLGLVAVLYFVAGWQSSSVVVGVFLALWLVGFAFRMRKKHSLRCSAYGALGGLLDKTLFGF
ncbi:hypothetical protein [Streptomyces rubiginosohelvolus]|uniref:hypothetical protein n=1 Tax=Streptomyces rubiginosohelvolus TaxID=67362 RepID=UPI0035D6BC89